MKQMILLFAFTAMMMAGCGHRNTQSAEIDNNGNVKVLLFHAVQRCATCKAIDSIVAEVISNEYADAVSDSSLVVIDIDISDRANLEIVDKYQILSTSLVIDAQGEVTDLTKEAFYYARTKPEELVRILKDKLDKALE